MTDVPLVPLALVTALAACAPKPAAPATAATAPTTPGTISRDAIDRVIRRKLPQILRCYQRELARHPDLGGKLAVSFVIARDGSVAEATVARTELPDDLVGECVLDQFRGMTFPAPVGGIVTVTYPFLFEP